MEVAVKKLDIQKLMTQVRQDIRKGFCSVTDACHILDVKKDTFYVLLKDCDTEIRRSKIQGKYLLKSIYKEVERLTI